MPTSSAVSAVRSAASWTASPGHREADARQVELAEATAVRSYVLSTADAEHWRAVLPATALLEIPYEALIEDQEGWTRRMLEFVGLPWDDACLEFHRTDRVVITSSKWQVRQKIYASSAGRWRNYREFLGPLERLIEPPVHA